MTSVALSKNQPSAISGFPVEDSVKCLGVWWCSSRKSIKEPTNKARGAFFAHGELGAYLNPLSSRSLVVMLYGSELWLLNELFCVSWNLNLFKFTTNNTSLVA